MFLSRVAVKNFRNLESLVVVLKSGLNVIVGENNAGKTNLLDALRVALGPASSGDIVRISEDDLFHDIAGKRSEEVRIDLEFSGLTEDEQAEMIEILKYNASNPTESTASIHFEFLWSAKSKRFQLRRWGGEREDAETSVPEDVFQSLPVTLLNALRDATTSLAPGRQSRLGRLLANSATEQDQTQITSIVKQANQSLENNELIKRVEGKISSTLKGAAGPTLSQDPVICSSEPQFERIVNNLRLGLRHSKIPEGLWGNIEELRLNGLGYNNLLYIATVISELSVAEDATLPLLLVEEPEAHLHPQLQTLLADFLAEGGTTSGGKRKVQTIITTHSPTIASHVDPAIIRVLHETPTGQRCICLDDCGLNKKESRQLSRMLDATRATLLFARGVVLVEGISEVLLVPVLARRIKIDLEQNGVSTIPVYGVDFATFGKLYGEGKLRTRVAILTDALSHAAQEPQGETWAEWLDSLRAVMESAIRRLTGKPRSLGQSFHKKKLGNEIRVLTRQQSSAPTIPHHWVPSTIHQAKGTEAECVVFFNPAPKGKIRCPSQDWWETSPTAEERRIAFVAVSRAIDTLILCVHKDTMANLETLRSDFTKLFQVEYA